MGVLVWYKDYFSVYLLKCFKFELICVFQFKEATPQQLMDSKLRCVFEVPNDEDSNTQATDAAATPASSSVQSTDAPRTPKSAAAGTTATPGKVVQPTDELKKATEEIWTLRKENSSLKLEILQLKVIFFSFYLTIEEISGST